MTPHLPDQRETQTKCMPGTGQDWSPGCSEFHPMYQIISESEHERHYKQRAWPKEGQELKKARNKPKNKISSAKKKLEPYFPLKFWNYCY
jgi:hypothetical protein